jgi:hypothetical protein
MVFPSQISAIFEYSNNMTFIDTMVRIMLRWCWRTFGGDVVAYLQPLPLQVGVLES